MNGKHESGGSADGKRIDCYEIGLCGLESNLCCAFVDQNARQLSARKKLYLAVSGLESNVDDLVQKTERKGEKLVKSWTLKKALVLNFQMRKRSRFQASPLLLRGNP